MAYLYNFYQDLAKYGLSKDYQLKLISLKLDCDDFFAENKFPFLGSYAKKMSIPVAKATAVKDIPMFAKTLPVYSGAADFAEKTNFPITFWVPENAIDILRAFNLAVDTDSEQPTVANTGRIIELALINDQNVTIGKIILTSVSVRGINTITYSSDGTGRPVEFTVVFSFYDAQFVEVRENIGFTEQNYGSTDNDNVPTDINTYSKFQTQNATTSSSKPLSPLQKLIGGLNSVSRGLRVAGNAASNVRGAARAIRGR